MLEKNIERYLVEEVKKIKGRCIKMNSQSSNGLPDRLVLLPGGGIYFLECKRPGEKLRPLQQYWKKILENLGFKYYKINSLEDVDRFIQEVR